MTNKPIARVIIAGSREFNDYDLLKSYCSKMLSNLIDKHQIIIVSGTAPGADRLGERFAKEFGFSLERYPADWNTFGRSAGYRRNQQMAEVANYLIAFSVNNSKGTGHMIDIMTKLGKPVRVKYITK